MIAESLYYNWSKEFLEAGKKRLAGLVEKPPRSARPSLEKPGTPRSTFNRWYDRFLAGGVEVLRADVARDRGSLVTVRGSAFLRLWKKGSPLTATLVDG